MKITLIENNILATNTIRKKLTKTLIDKGIDVKVLTTGSTDELNAAAASGINVVDVGAANEKITGSTQYFRRLYKVLKNDKPDLILTFTIRPNIWGNLAARLLRIPVISNITGVGALFSSKQISYKIARTLYKVALLKTNWIFFQNEDDRNLFLRNGMADERLTEIIPGSGVDTEYFHPMLHENKSDFTFLFIGRLIKDKGVLEYVRAAEILQAKGFAVVCRIVGPIWSQNFKANAISEALVNQWIQSETIVYDGDTFDVRPFIAASDCVVLPSYREGMSNVLLEAASMEKISVATNVTGCKEIVLNGVTGFLANPKDAEDLADNMIKAYNLSTIERLKMGQAARRRMQAMFEKKIVIDAYLKAIKKIGT